MNGCCDNSGTIFCPCADIEADNQRRNEMELVYYHAKSGSIFIIESDNGTSMSMYYALVIKNKNSGWTYLGEV